MAEAKLVQILYYKLKGVDIRPEAHFVNASPDDNVLYLREHIAIEEKVERDDIVIWKPRQPLSSSELMRQLSNIDPDRLQKICDNLSDNCSNSTVSDLFNMTQPDTPHSSILVVVVPGSIELCYHIIEHGEALPVVGSVVLSRSATVGDLRRRIASKRSASDDDICIWMPHEPLSRKHKDFVARLSAHNNDVDRFSRNIIEEHFGAPVADLLGMSSQRRDSSPTTLVVRIYSRVSPMQRLSLRTTRRTRAADILTRLDQHFERSRSKAWGSPSTSAQLENYREHQGSDLPILDGRYTKSGPVLPLPIGLFHPVFSRFVSRIRDETLMPPDEVVAATFGFMQSVSEIALYDDARREQTLHDLTAILGMSVDEHAIVCGHPDSSAVVALAIVEEAGELSEELGLDPAVRGEFSYIQHWTQPGQIALFEECFCPSFILSVVGPWLGVSGAIYTTDPVVERLLDRHWISITGSHTLTHSHMREVARMLYALRLALFELKDWYATVHVTPKVMPIRKRIFPLATSCTLAGGEELHFRYLVPLQKTTTTVEQGCVTFLVADCADDRRRFVVKFVGQYGEAAHRFLAAHGYAPELLYVGPVWCGDEVAQAGSGSRRMVVMEYIPGETAQDAYPTRPLPSHVTEEVRQALKLLHAEGMVHGDIHEENIILDNRPGEGRKVKILDFDWAGKQGVVRYPLNIQLDLELDPPSRWAKGVGGYELIQATHDDLMLEAMCR